MKKEAGFSILEFIVSMTVLTLLFAGVMSVFVPLLQRTKLEAGIAQTQMENIVGLEMLRTDLVHSGHGLPWTLAGLTYNEIASDPHGLNNATTNPPQALALAVNAGTNNSDYLAIKANNVALTDVSQKISFIQQGALVPNVNPKVWGRADLDFGAEDRVLVMRLMDPDEKIPMTIVPQASGSFYIQWSAIAALPSGGFTNEVQYLFGLTSGENPIMPFNRADYFISTTSVPPRCFAPNTGVLVKSVVDHDTAELGPQLPILDCVADFQIAFGVDTTAVPDKSIDCFTNNLATVLPAADLNDATIARTVRERVREVRTYILVQEGLFQYEYRFNDFDAGGTSVVVGEQNAPAQDCSTNGSDEFLGKKAFNLSSLGADYRKYRWRVVRMAVQPENLTRSLFGGDQQQ
jgi:type II secretory pathway pseudopilin PulG